MFVTNLGFVNFIDQGFDILKVYMTKLFGYSKRFSVLKVVNTVAFRSVIPKLGGTYLCEACVKMHGDGGRKSG